MKLSKTIYGGLLAMSLACLAGCGSRSSANSQAAEAVKDFPKMSRALQTSPELKLAGLKTSQQKAAFLQERANDSTFEPKMHKDMLEKYSKDNDPDVAAAAKALLDRAQ